MPQFIKVTTTDELADQQAKLVEVEGQKIALLCPERLLHPSKGTVVLRSMGLVARHVIPRFADA